MPSPAVKWALIKRSQRSTHRKLPAEGARDTLGEDRLCRRCKEINLRNLLNTNRTHRTKPSDGKPYVKPLLEHLGAYDRFDRTSPSFELSECPLCILVADLIPEKPAFQLEPGLDNMTFLPPHAVIGGMLPVTPGDLYLVSASALDRIEPDLDYENHEWYANYLYVGVGKLVQALDCIAEVVGAVGDVSSSKALAVRRVNPGAVNIKAVKSWIRRCEENHFACCEVAWSDKLHGIHLIEVETNRIVQHPGPKTEYLCLSYVWGGRSTQDIKIQNRVLLDAPQTILDAIEFVNRLGKKYLWVDSICIDQSNNSQKLQHIRMMDRIYGGAWATIVALDGEAAGSGLPRVKSETQSRLSQRQMEYALGSIRLLNALPTLQQQIDQSTWATRGWTYQEGLLSTRNIFFTREQVYYSCNAMQCCEAIHDAHSPFHSRAVLRRPELKLTSRSFGLSGSFPSIGRGIFRNPDSDLPRNIEDVNNGRLYKYNQVLLEYSSRDLKYDSDALVAFQGILNRLGSSWLRCSEDWAWPQDTSSLQNRFTWGLPVCVLPQALLFSHPDRVTRRKEFPSWSWLGWKGKLAVGAHTIADNQAPFRAWKWLSNRLVAIYSDSEENQTNGTIAPEINDYFRPMEQSDKEKLLVVEACVCDLKFTSSRSMHSEKTGYYSLHGSLQEWNTHVAIICPNSDTVDLIERNDGRFTAMLIWCLRTEYSEEYIHCVLLLEALARMPSETSEAKASSTDSVDRVIRARRVGTVSMHTEFGRPWEELQANGTLVQVVLE